MATGCWRAFLYNYKNRGPFPPGKLNFHHKTSWPQTKKSIHDHVIVRDNAVSAGSAATTGPHGLTAGYPPIDPQSSSRRSLASHAYPRADRHASNIVRTSRSTDYLSEIQYVNEDGLREFAGDHCYEMSKRDFRSCGNNRIIL